MKIGLAIVLFVWICAVTGIAQQTSTVIEPSRWHNTPVDNARTNQRLAEYADKNDASGTIPRMSIYDIGYPHSADEFAKLDGHAILMITSLSPTQGIFPLKRVYATVGSETVELKLIKEFLSQGDPSARVSKVFGRYRSDNLYLMPFYIRRTIGASIWADPANGEKAMQVAVFSSPVSEALNFLPNQKPSGKGPGPDFLEVFLRREYPAFFEKK